MKHVKCKYCEKETNTQNIKRHEDTCYLNPGNITECVICSKPIKDYKHSKGTCSRSCANTHFRSGDENGNWKGENYQSICFLHHKKQCVVCDEDKIIAVHHYDHNHENNDPVNLVPLCPTHHQYVHSRYASLVKTKIDDYVEKFKLRFI